MLSVSMKFFSDFEMLNTSNSLLFCGYKGESLFKIMWNVWLSFRRKQDNLLCKPWIKSLRQL